MLAVVNPEGENPSWARGGRVTEPGEGRKSRLSRWAKMEELSAKEGTS
jgi:hypothetical protein